MNATVLNIDKFLEDNKPESFKLTENLMTFYAGGYDFVIKPGCDGKFMVIMNVV